MMGGDLSTKKVPSHRWGPTLSTNARLHNFRYAFLMYVERNSEANFLKCLFDLFCKFFEIRRLWHALMQPKLVLRG